MTTPTSESLHPAAVAVATWWADKAGTIGDNGDRSDAGAMTTMLALLAGAQGQVPDASSRQRFVYALARRVTADLAQQAKWEREYEPSVTIGVDYGPDRVLADAAAEAGVPRGAFPWKTMTWTYRTHVVTSLGYQGRSELVWSADDWERPVCGQGKYGPSPDYDRLPWRCSGLRYHDGDHTFDVPDPLCAAKVMDYDGQTIVCRHPEQHNWHVTDRDGYQSPKFHEFVATAVTR